MVAVLQLSTGLSDRIGCIKVIFALTPCASHLPCFFSWLRSPCMPRPTGSPEARLKRPEMRKALESLNESAIVDEWIHLTEIPAPSG